MRRPNGTTSTPLNDKDGLPTPPKFRPFPILTSLTAASTTSCPRRPSSTSNRRKEFASRTPKLPRPPAPAASDWEDDEDEQEDSITATPALVPCRLRLDSTTEESQHDLDEDVADGVRSRTLLNGVGAKKSLKSPVPLETLLSQAQYESDPLNVMSTSAMTTVDIHKESQSSATSSCGRSTASSSPHLVRERLDQVRVGKKFGGSKLILCFQIDDLDERTPMIVHNGSLKKSISECPSSLTSRSNSIEGKSSCKEDGEYVLMSNKNKNNNNNLNNCASNSETNATTALSNQAPPKC